MNNILLNYKTSAAGFAAVLAAVADIAHALSVGAIPNLMVDVPAIASGIGLLFAKDASVSGTATVHGK
jgi:hypothetical protein